MKDYLKFVAFLLIPISILVSCSDDNEKLDINLASTETIKVNTFIKKDMKDYYLWTNEMPQNIDINYEKDSKEYFKKLLYREEDRWSFITDDYEGLMNSFAGKETSFGWSLAFGKFSGTENYFALVEYVNPDSPASEYNIKRSDIIFELDGLPISTANYRDLIYKNQVNIVMGKYTAENTIGKDETRAYTINSRELDINPVLHHDILEIGTNKIGYIFYTGFVSKYNSELDKVFGEFKSKGITDLIVDVRYNPGGAVSSAIHLCSMIAPASNVSSEDILINENWNTQLQDYWTSNNKPLYSTFDSKVVDNNLNLDLKKVYFITGRGSASASELVIIGLEPYMDVIKIGETTHGKYVASTTLRPMKLSGERWIVDSSIENWAIQPIIYKFSNAEGFTDFKDGLAPTEPIKDNIKGIIGDVYEPLLKKTIELITGSVPAAYPKVKRLLERPNFEMIERISSRYKKYRNTLIVDNRKYNFHYRY